MLMRLPPLEIAQRLCRTTWCLRVLWRLPLIAALTAGASVADSESSPPSNVDVARSIAVSGRQAFDSGDYDTAVVLFQRAYALFQAPTLVLYEARALKEMGRLLESEAAYRRASSVTLAENAPPQFITAIETARVEGLALAESIPTLTIRIVGAATDDTRLRITRNGNPVSPLTLGTANRLDPGRYRLEATLGANRSDTLEEQVAVRQHKTVVLNLTAPISVTPRPTPLADPGSSPSGANLSVVMTYLSAGLGVAGLGTGVVTGMLASERHLDAENLCSTSCNSGSEGAKAVSQFRTLRTASTIAYSVGAAGTLGSLVLWFAIPRKKDASVATIEPWVTPRSAGVRGHF